MLPGLPVRVHDAYIAGEGILHASLFGLVSVANLRGTPEAAQGELLRLLAEAAWYPTALLPSQGVRWEAVDDSSAKATLKDGDSTVDAAVPLQRRRPDQLGARRGARGAASGRECSNPVGRTLDRTSCATGCASRSRARWRGYFPMGRGPTGAAASPALSMSLHHDQPCQITRCVTIS